MANTLSDTKKQQVIALGQLGWTLRRIEAATGVRLETAGDSQGSGARWHSGFVRFPAIEPMRAGAEYVISSWVSAPSCP